MADITPAMVKAAQAFDYENRLRGHPWARVGNGQVRRLIAGALGPQSAVVSSGELAAFGLAMEQAQEALAAARAENAALREHVGTLAEVEAAARRHERARVRAAVDGLKFTLFRPGNGPAQTQAMDVVPLEDLLKLLEGGGPT